MFDNEAWKNEFIKWLQKQTKKDGTLYSKLTLDSYINRLKNGLSLLQDSQYKK